MAEKPSAGTDALHKLSHQRGGHNNEAPFAISASAGLGALLLGYDDNDGLRFAGKVGTGFDTSMLLSLYARFQTLTVCHRSREILQVAIV